MQESDEYNLINDKFITGKNAEIFLEQYKLYVNLMDNVSARRHQANSFFLTVNSIAITALSGVIGTITPPIINALWLLVAAICGIMFSITWRRLIFSYHQLNSGKFKIIHLMEQNLPLRLFEAEWKVLKQGDGSVYKPFFKIESFVPIVFIFMYIALGIYAIITFIP